MGAKGIKQLRIVRIARHEKGPVGEDRDGESMG